MRFLKFAAILLVFICACVPVSANGLFAFTNNHEVVSLITNNGTFLTSASPFDPGNNNSGWWSPTFSNAFTTNDNYFVGSDSGDLFNNFFTFAIPLDLSSFTSVTLSIPRGGDGGPSTTGVPFTYSLFDVSTSAAVLNATTGTSAAIYNDLGSGVSYGSIVVTNLTTPDPLVITLNASALAALNTSKGGFFSIGGTLNSVPEPASAVLLALPLLALAVYRRRRA